jgi:hypothetical protein
VTIQARGGEEVAVDNAEAGLATALSRLHSLFGSEEAALDPYSIGDYGSIVGSRASDLALSSGPSGLEAEVDEAWRLAHVAPVSGFVPGFLHGSLQGDVTESTHIAVALNGVVREVSPVFDVGPGGARFNAIVPDGAFVAGFNALELFSVSGPPANPLVESIEFDNGGRFTVSVAADGNVVSISDTTGTSWVVAEDPRIVGAVDEAVWGVSDFMRSTLEDLQVAGWAVDQRSMRPVDEIVFFINGVFAGSVEPDHERSDIEDGYQNSQVRLSGFRARLSQFLPVASLELRAFALSNENAVELPISPEALTSLAAG